MSRPTLEWRGDAIPVSEFVAGLIVSVSEEIANARVSE